MDFELYLAQVSDLLNGAEFSTDEVAYIRSYWREGATVEHAADELCEARYYPESDGQPSEYDEWQDLYGGDDYYSPYDNGGDMFE